MLFNFSIKDTLTQFKERKITKWLTIYLSSGLTVLGAVNLFSSRYNIPGTLFDTLVILLLFGVVSTIVAAWNHGRAGFSGWKKEEIAAHIIILTVAVIAVVSIKSEDIKFIEYKAKSIAVLPFRNLSGNQEDEFFSNGITEDIMIQLSKISDLKVISKTSMSKYKDGEKSIPEIGKELGVETILEGSIRRVGSRVRISGELIDTKNDSNIWAEYYDREIKDIFAIQSDVAQRIAQALKAKLTSAEKQRIERKSTLSIDAYTLYLKGREYYSRYTNNENDIAIDLFNKALKIDKNYALAYSGLADAYAQRVQRYQYQNTWLDSSLLMSQKAVALNPDLPEPYKSLALYYDLNGYYKKAIQYYLKAIEINPNYAPAISNIGSLYWWTGQYDKALPWLEKNISLSPTRAAGYNSLGLLQIGLTNLSTAEKLFKTSIELQPDYTPGISNLVKLYIIEDKIDLAVSTAVHYFNLFSEDDQTITAAGDAYLFAGNPDSALFYYQKAGPSIDLGCILILAKKEKEGKKMLDSLIQQTLDKIKNYTEDFIPSFDLARAYAVLGKTNESVKWFEKAVSAGWLFYTWSSKDPLMKNVWNNQAFINQLNIQKSKVEKMRI